ncbi:very short patch repair endonuclease [Cellulomonas sp. T2.31MG-18]|uniref:very short patch repair endonuclease n=1 Tax=Cellulomonas sp. T2.31MG-18 TaxID=3157619 RepID=UPI00366D7258
MFHVPPHPGSSSAAVSRRMSRLPRRDNAAELAVRRILHAHGLRYRVVFPVSGRPRRSIDIAFTRAMVAVFIDGCYWHGCPEHGTQPSANSEWWRTKIAANQARDVDTSEHLANLGWTVLRFWEHVPAEDVATRVSRVVSERVSAVAAATSMPQGG